MKKSKSQEQLLLREQLAILESDAWESIVQEFEEKLEIWQQTNDLDPSCDTLQGWHQRKGQMNMLRQVISLLDMKRADLQALERPDEENRYVDTF